MNRETFLTLNKTRLFTADQVVDIVQSERDTCPQNKIWQHCPVAEQIRKQERDKVLDEVILRINNILNGLYEEKRKSFWFRLSQAKSNSIAEFTLRYVADMVKELRRAGG